MPPSRADKGKGRADDQTLEQAVQPKPTKVKPPNATKNSLETNRLLPFQRNILKQLVPPENALPNAGDAMLVMARGLGLRTIVTTFVRLFLSTDVGVELS